MGTLFLFLFVLSFVFFSLFLAMVQQEHPLTHPAQAPNHKDYNQVLNFVFSTKEKRLTN